MRAFHSINLFLFSRHYVPANSVALSSALKHTQPATPLFTLTNGKTLETSALKLLTVANLRYQVS